MRFRSSIGIIFQNFSFYELSKFYSRFLKNFNILQIILFLLWNFDRVWGLWVWFRDCSESLLPSSSLYSGKQYSFYFVNTHNYYDFMNTFWEYYECNLWFIIGFIMEIDFVAFCLVYKGVFMSGFHLYSETIQSWAANLVVIYSCWYLTIGLSDL